MTTKCQYCGSTQEPFHRDHIVPRSRGGGDDTRNCVIACAACNLEKGARTPTEWRANGLPPWIYEIERELVQHYRMAPRRRGGAGSVAPTRWPTRYFCGGRLVADDAFLAFYQQEAGPPFDRPTLTIFNEYGGRREVGELVYPGSEDPAQYLVVAHVGHAECGPDLGYAIEFYRLDEDWELHLATSKSWGKDSLAPRELAAARELAVQIGALPPDWQTRSKR